MKLHTLLLSLLVGLFLAAAPVKLSAANFADGYTTGTWTMKDGEAKIKGTVPGPGTLKVTNNGGAGNVWIVIVRNGKVMGVEHLPPGGGNWQGRVLGGEEIWVLDLLDGVASSLKYEFWD